MRSRSALQAAGVPTLHAFRARMAERRTWWRDMLGIGPIKARELGQFMSAQFGPALPWPVSARLAPSNVFDTGPSAGVVLALMSTDWPAVPDELGVMVPIVQNVTVTARKAAFNKDSHLFSNRDVAVIASH
ncbi:hypothetical protein K2O51_32005 (plasmid) [Cupriavidus pinatubonensis]|uniref:phage integrase family protein n=1 Tax=Cupriavidus pinatubonensis TaxID=248026 RepID=UPI001129583B|nr:phage integrase family protein [Cupriavidus pinatubonensis]QYY34014.1 hypothetical protein K2O51_32005 [Cupriavidus pinatubonensis]TPQ30160.1 hypothetical protein C2U69_31545 [Cupriavidus pinatubonensis]